METKDFNRDMIHKNGIQNVNGITPKCIHVSIYSKEHHKIKERYNLPSLYVMNVTSIIFLLIKLGMEVFGGNLPIQH